MDEKIILVMVILVGFGLVSAIIYWSGPALAGWGKTRTYLTTSGITLLGVVLAIYAYWISASIDQTTLFETRLPGNSDTREGDPIITRTVEFSVEHPGTPHQLMISPRLEMMQQANFDVRIGIRLWETVTHYLIDETLVFEPHTETKIDRNGYRTTHTKWEAKYLSFIPEDYGIHQIELDYLVTNIPDLYLRIEDPLKQDGVRDSSLR